MGVERLFEKSTEPPPIDLARFAGLQDFHPPQRERSLGDYWRTLQKRKWTVLACIVVVFIMAVLISLHTTRVYEAVTRIVINPQSASPLNFKDNNNIQQYEDAQQILNTQIKILQSDTMAELVIHRLHLDSRPEFTGTPAAQTSGGIAITKSSPQENSRQEGLIRQLQGSLRVQQIPDTSIIEIRYSDGNPALAAEIANAETAVFIEQNIKSRYDSTMQAADWLSKQLADMQIKMETSQQRLIQYQKDHNIVGADDKQNLITDKLDELNKELTAAQADRIQKQSLYEITTSSNPESLNSVLEDTVLNGLRQQENDLQIQYARLSAQFGPNYTRVVEVKNQLDQVELNRKQQLQNTVNRIQNDYQTALKRERMLQGALAEQTTVAQQLNENAIEYKVLKQEADSNRQLYDGLLQQLKEASLAAGLNSSNTHVVDRARVPLYPIKPNIPMNLEFALLIGLVSGIALAFGLEAVDITVRTPEQAETISGLPTLGIIPLQNNTGPANSISKANPFQKAARPATVPRPLVSHLDPRSEIAEAYRALRTSILFSTPSHPPRSILVTSSVPKDGKTTTCINVAIVLAQQGKRVLLVDADMRRPTMHAVFGLDRRIGLSNILTGSAQANEGVQATMEPNLFVMAAGHEPPHPSELLSSSLMRELIRKWTLDYDHVIIDSPPVITVTDAVLLSVQSDAVLLIIRSGHTMSAHVRRTLSLLQSVKANVLGVVVNAADMTSPDYHYYGSKYGKYNSYFEKKQKDQKSKAGEADESEVFSEE